MGGVEFYPIFFLGFLEFFNFAKPLTMTIGDGASLVRLWSKVAHP